MASVAAASALYILLAGAFGSHSSGGAFAAVLVGTLAERVLAYRRAIALDA